MLLFEELLEPVLIVLPAHSMLFEQIHESPE